MRTDNMRSSDNVEDRRGQGGGRGFGGGPKLAMGGVGGIVLLVLYLIMGGNPLSLLQSPGGGAGTGGGGSGGLGGGGQLDPAQEQVKQVVTKVLGDTEDVWRDLFRQMGKQYREPGLVLFTGATPTACGTGDAAMGPFYCTLDQKIYIDLDFYAELAQRFKAPGDFAQAYVIAHEVGHHVQNLMGTTGRVQAMERSVGERERNDISVRLELQADYLAGVWAHFAAKRNLLDPGDIDEGIGAAAAVGDDRLQKQSQGRVVPDSFTHGSSEQRIRWFRKGFESGDPLAGDTFKVDRP